MVARVLAAVPGVAAAGAVAYGAWLWSLPSGWAGWTVGGLIVLADLVWSRLSAEPEPAAGGGE